MDGRWCTCRSQLQMRHFLRCFRRHTNLQNDDLAVFEDVRRHPVSFIWLLFSFSSPSSKSLFCLTAVKSSELSFTLFVSGGLEPKKLTYIKSKPRAPPSQQKEQTRLQLANCKSLWFINRLYSVSAYQFSSAMFNLLPTTLYCWYHHYLLFEVPCVQCKVLVTFLIKIPLYGQLT